MDLRERKRGLRSTSGDDGHEKPVESCLTLHEMDLKPLHLHCNLLWTAAIAAQGRKNNKVLRMRAGSIEDLLEEGDGAGADFFLAALFL